MAQPQPIDILRYYRRCLEAAGALKQVVLLGLDAGTLTAGSQFFGMTPAEFDEALAELRTELDHQVVMMLTASFEAIFQTDFQQRIMGQKRGDLTRRMRRWWKNQTRGGWDRKWVSVERLLEGFWKERVAGHREAIGQFKALVKLRHWLAHGRYWSEKSGLGWVDPFRAWHIGKVAFAILPEFPALPDVP